jgi:rSAM/selenodomain-associated transferase 1
MPSLNMTNALKPVDKPVKKVDNSVSPQRASAVLGIFAKSPVAGKVKTRLSPPLPPQQAADLYRVMLDETIRRFAGQAFDLVIFYAGGEDYFSQGYPNQCRQPQIGVDLGARMAEALNGLLQQGYGQAVLIGSDSPDLPLSVVNQAFAALGDAEVVVVPAADGGYVLIGESRHQPELFGDLPWSQPDLMEKTRGLLTAKQINWRLLPPWEDVDDPASLGRLVRRSPQSLTAAFIQDQLPELAAGLRG